MRHLRYPTLLALLIIPAALARGQSDTLKRGFEVTAPAIASAEDMAQSDLWVMQVDFKPIRLVTVELPDPQTGEMREETIYYIVYRAQNMPLQGPPTYPERVPVNNYDAPPGPALFVPEFTLVSAEPQEVVGYSDVIVPKAQKRIIEREMRGPHEGVPLKNSVDVVQPIQPPGSAGSQPIYGVAMFRGVDPTIDRFKVIASGFSNGFRKTNGPDGKPLIQRRDILLSVWRPGDRYELDERDFRYDAQPQWIYRAEGANLTETKQKPATDQATGPQGEEAAASGQTPSADQPQPANPFAPSNP